MYGCDFTKKKRTGRSTKRVESKKSKVGGMMDILAQKKEILRKQLLHTRKIWDFEKRANAADAIQQNLFALPAFQKAETVFCYVSTEFEIDTRNILQWLWQKKKRVAIPLCFEKGNMCACQVDSFLDMQSGKFGILEPKSYCTKVEPSNISFSIVPALACDQQGHRLGYGGGYYDRYLAGNNIVSAGLCYDDFFYTALPSEPWDRKLQYVITESHVHTFST